MNFEKIIIDNIVIEKVNLTRATYKEAEEFNDFIQNDIVNGWKRIIIDLKNCEFMDSSFVGVLINSLKQLEKSKGSLKLASVHDDAQVILDITRISNMFHIYADNEEAIRSFNAN